MARIRKEKGQSSKVHPEPKKQSGKASVAGALPFGGNQKDAELLKGLDENLVTGSVNKDVSNAICLLIDVLIVVTAHTYVRCFSVLERSIAQAKWVGPQAQRKGKGGAQNSSKSRTPQEGRKAGEEGQ